jgi:predicted acetyltransferase
MTLLWQDEAFDVAWSGRQNWLIVQGDVVVGFFSLSRACARCTFVNCRLLKRFRGMGAGSWAIDQVIGMARKETAPGFAPDRIRK